MKKASGGKDTMQLRR